MRGRFPDFAAAPLIRATSREKKHHPIPSRTVRRLRVARLLQG
jgi:hypothetical protein